MPDPPKNSEPEYRARILVEIVLSPDEERGRKRGSWDENAVLDACTVKSWLEDPEIQNRIDEAGSRGRIIGAWVQDVRQVTFSDPLPMEQILAGHVNQRIVDMHRDDGDPPE